MEIIQAGVGENIWDDQDLSDPLFLEDAFDMAESEVSELTDLAAEQSLYDTNNVDLYKSEPGVFIDGTNETSDKTDTKTRGSKAKTKGAKKGKQNPDARKEKMAAACRKFRAKRKQMVEELREKNAVLEQDREVYLVRIAELQTEAQALRDCGNISIIKENDLLRAEIRKHKVFIRGLVDAVGNIPSVTDEEKLRILRRGVDSGIGQITGIAYTSAVDPSWKQANPVVVDGQTIKLRYQYLPLGVSVHEAKRLNVRVDFTERSESLEELFYKLWNFMNDDDLLRHVMSKHFPKFLEGVEFACKEIFPNLSHDWQKEKIKVLHYQEKFENESPVDAVYAVTHRRQDIYPSFIPKDIQAHEELGLPGDDEVKRLGAPIPGLIISSNSCSAVGSQNIEFEPRKEGVRRITAPMIEGAVLVPKKNAGCHWTYVCSFPLDPKDMVGISLDTGPVIDEDGDLSEEGLAMLQAIMCFMENTEGKQMASSKFKVEL
mmetsp:Transcript_44300/g.70821  ORF Transcript_44300/g.70821 Transcript_44300/m.70821 type:complete len:488 (-) Transcript_44300:1865-3328(-)|eukprot:CAMPEP_0203757938 /NCGR_PEP_ID=MMETSP0098-20131031/10769_1 /ASSEMBLY_ACC=CAM_ASM_000208 /TAXON_ID=96639 /ORGANISM=" , Strain NY0313808BC1" /LENGTH=487 /DNA_ID=CAMNT_0050650183 /DNA_START=175 /DNA_END=1638 /DNA_ORIENTATION=+